MCSVYHQLGFLNFEENDVSPRGAKRLITLSVYGGGGIWHCEEKVWSKILEGDYRHLIPFIFVFLSSPGTARALNYHMLFASNSFFYCFCLFLKLRFGVTRSRTKHSLAMKTVKWLHESSSYLKLKTFASFFSYYCRKLENDKERISTRFPKSCVCVSSRHVQHSLAAIIILSSGKNNSAELTS